MVSNKNPRRRPRRPYTLRARARRRDEVHRRITLAAVQLHGTVGPARTTVSDVAKIAGVRRATVYNHFPTDADLLDACSSHWFAENPPPDPAPWKEIPDPAQRAEAALAAIYAYYDRGRDMLEHVLRDAPLLPALDDIVRQKWSPFLDGIVDILSEGWGAHDAATAAGESGGRTTPGKVEAGVRATLRVALDFFTWRTLAGSGLSNEDAARLAAAWFPARRAQAY